MNSSNTPPLPPAPLLSRSLPDPLPPPRYNQSRRLRPPHPAAGAKKKPRARRKPDFSGPPKANRPCSVCGKSFSSLKALFGHMRCHPERRWRGINPPPRSAAAAQFTDEEYEVASALLLLADGPPPESSSGELGGAEIMRPLYSFFDGSIKSKKQKSFSNQISPSSSCFCSQDDGLLDLNLPPPLENGEDGEGEIGPALELKLGI